MNEEVRCLKKSLIIVFSGGAQVFLEAISGIIIKTILAVVKSNEGIVTLGFEMYLRLQSDTNTKRNNKVMEYV